MAIKDSWDETQGATDEARGARGPSHLFQESCAVTERGEQKRGYFAGLRLLSVHIPQHCNAMFQLMQIHPGCFCLLHRTANGIRFKGFGCPVFLETRL